MACDVSHASLAGHTGFEPACHKTSSLRTSALAGVAISSELCTLPAELMPRICAGVGSPPALPGSPALGGIAAIGHCRWRTERDLNSASLAVLTSASPAMLPVHIAATVGGKSSQAFGILPLLDQLQQAHHRAFAAPQFLICTTDLFITVLAVPFAHFFRQFSAIVLNGTQLLNQFPLVIAGSKPVSQRKTPSRQLHITFLLHRPRAPAAQLRAVRSFPQHRSPNFARI